MPIGSTTQTERVWSQYLTQTPSKSFQHEDPSPRPSAPIIKFWFRHWDIAVYRLRVTGFQQYSWAFCNHILLSPGYAPGTIAVNVTWIEREFNVCQTHRSMYTPVFNRLWAIARYWSKIATFSYFLAFNAPARSGPWDNRGKCHTVGKRIQCLSNASQHAPIYLQPFLRYSNLLVENCDIFDTPPLFSGPAGGDSVGISQRSWYTQN